MARFVRIKVNFDGDVLSSPWLYQNVNIDHIVSHLLYNSDDGLGWVTLVNGQGFYVEGESYRELLKAIDDA